MALFEFDPDPLGHTALIANVNVDRLDIADGDGDQFRGPTRFGQRGDIVGNAGENSVGYRFSAQIAITHGSASFKTGLCRKSDKRKPRPGWGAVFRMYFTRQPSFHQRRHDGSNKISPASP